MLIKPTGRLLSAKSIPRAKSQLNSSAPQRNRTLASLEQASHISILLSTSMVSLAISLIRFTDLLL